MSEPRGTTKNVILPPRIPRGRAVVNRSPRVPLSPSRYCGPVSPSSGSTLITPNPSLNSNSPQLEWDEKQEELIGFEIEKKDKVSGIKLISETRDDLLETDITGLGFSSEEEVFKSPSSSCTASSRQLEVLQGNPAQTEKMASENEFKVEVAKIGKPVSVTNM